MKNLTGVETLSKFSKIDKEEIKKIWEDVQNNRKILDSCSFHEFEPCPIKPRKYICKNCKGTVDAIAKYWYEMGIKHKENHEQKA